MMMSLQPKRSIAARDDQLVKTAFTSRFNGVMLAFLVLIAGVMASPTPLEKPSVSDKFDQYHQLNKVNQDALLLPEIDRDIKIIRRSDDYSGLPMPLPPRLQPPPVILVLPPTTGGSLYGHGIQLETEKDNLKVLTTPMLPDPACKSCPKALQKHPKMLTSNLDMSCGGALIEPVDPFPNAPKYYTKRVNFGNVYSYKWDKKRQSDGKALRSLEHPGLKVFLLGPKAFLKGLLHKL